MRAPQAEKYGYLQYFEVESARRRRKKTHFAILGSDFSGIYKTWYLQKEVRSWMSWAKCNAERECKYRRP